MELATIHCTCNDVSSQGAASLHAVESVEGGAGNKKEINAPKGRSEQTCAQAKENNGSSAHCGRQVAVQCWLHSHFSAAAPKLAHRLNPQTEDLFLEAALVAAAGVKDARTHRASCREYHILHLDLNRGVLGRNQYLQPTGSHIEPSRYRELVVEMA